MPPEPHLQSLYTVLPPETSPKGRMLSQLAGYSLTAAPIACYILTTVAQGEGYLKVLRSDDSLGKEGYFYT